MKMGDEEIGHMKAQIEWMYTQTKRVFPGTGDQLAWAFARAMIIGLQNMEPLVPPTIERERLARWIQREIGTTSDTKMSLADARKIAVRLKQETILPES